MNKFKAFTLAEIMIVLTVIGILTAILLPSAIQGTPDENVLKFKKAHATLYKVINELVNSEQYYKDGDLGIRANGALIDGTHTGDYTYLCQTIADLLSTKSVNCSSNIIHYFEHILINTADANPNNVDLVCKNNSARIGAEIITTDSITYYQASAFPFGATNAGAYDEAVETCGDNGEDMWWCKSRLFGGATRDFNNFDTAYKIFCIDIDGIPSGGSAACDDVNDVCPFGYGIRADGKIMTGKRADEWVKKSIQEKD